MFIGVSRSLVCRKECWQLKKGLRESAVAGVNTTFDNIHNDHWHHGTILVIMTSGQIEFTLVLNTRMLTTSENIVINWNEVIEFLIWMNKNEWKCDLAFHQDEVLCEQKCQMVHHNPSNFLDAESDDEGQTVSLARGQQVMRLGPLRYKAAMAMGYCCILSSFY